MTNTEKKFVPYIVSERINPKTGSDSVFYPAASSYGIVGLNTICQDIARESSLTRGDIKNTVESLIDFINAYLFVGYKVRLDGIGLLSIGFDVETKGKPEDVTVDCVKAVKLHFRADNAMRESLKNIPIAPYENKPGAIGGVATNNSGNGSGL